MTTGIENFVLDCPGVEPGDVVVTGFAVSEQLFDGYRVGVMLLCSVELDLDALLGKKASLRAVLADGTERAFHGEVAAATLEQARSDVYFGHVEIAARVEKLKLGHESRMFQDESIKDVILKLLKDAGISGSGVAWEAADPPPRPYIVQHAESDFTFMRRLLYQQGIGFAVWNTDTEDQIVFFDDDAPLVPIDGDSELTDRASNTGTAEEQFEDLRDCRRGVCDEAMTRDYNFTTPTADLDCRKKAEGSTGREVYLHPGGYAEKPDGDRLVQRVLERLQLRKRVMRGKSLCSRMQPGRTFTTQLHARADVNTDHLILAVTHRGDSVSTPDGSRELSYENRFVTVPKGTPYRPDVPVALPVLGGVQVAFVTTPGEDTHADENGRSKVRFPWDRRGITDDKSSTWLRVGQLSLGGSMIIPRKDFEVIVDFEMGDVDRPFIAGHLYNGELAPPYPLPEGKIKVSFQSATTGGSGGCNELRYDCTAGSESMLINGSHDMNTSVDDAASSTVKNNQTMAIGSNHTVSVGTTYKHEVIGARTLTCSANQSINVTADYQHTVGGAKTINIDGARNVTVGGNHDENVKTTLDRTVDSIQSITGITGVTRKVLGASKTSSAVWAEIASARASSAASRSETVGALKLIKAKNFSMTAGAAYSLTCAAMSVTCGGGRTDQAGAVAVTSPKWTVKAKNIVFSAENSINIIAGGVKITMKSGGSIDIKAASVDLTGVKELNQVTFDAN